MSSKEWHKEYEQRPERKASKKLQREENRLKPKTPEEIAKKKNYFYQYYHSKKNDPEFMEKQRNERRKRITGWTKEEYQSKMLDQEGKCKICGIEMEIGLTARGACADHCHKTGAKRAILCRRCNGALGGFLDDPRILRSAAAYVEHFANNSTDREKG